MPERVNSSGRPPARGDLFLFLYGYVVTIEQPSTFVGAILRE
jgi:hypothetical protein